MRRVGIAADHGGFALKGQLVELLRGSGYEVVDFGAHQLNPADDYPDFIIPMARAVAAGEVERGVALCGSGVGASIAANKVGGVRARLIHKFSPLIRASKMTTWDSEPRTWPSMRASLSKNRSDVTWPPRRSSTASRTRCSGKTRSSASTTFSGRRRS